ncbi:putative GAF sensor protein [Gloeothece citriformis PCC 7424]|uniref:Putative GAF sensor protein n=1 Tax=Gloeothece citriformis (strain PCC 7424) TaxID=65393 RepID=B7KBH3_GLOC7|nr:GAF domain-containing protein [Gloeothece citriformis]ACK71529.1 putative GAF sensor protein [Gloeothece citriformis PCC 7424]
MENQSTFIYKLLEVSSLLETTNNLEESLRDLASSVAYILEAQRCSIMLISELEQQEDNQYYIQVFTHYGNLPPSAYQEVTLLNKGIAGYVAATGQPLLIKDITQSPFLSAARYPQENNPSLICAPIVIKKQVLGVINVSCPTQKPCFDEKDLQLLKVFTQSTAKTLHIAQLQAMLKSRFVTMAVVNQLEDTPVSESISIHPNPTLLAKLVAKSFFRELTNSGFGPNQIIEISTEVLNLLQNTLNRHKQRLTKGEDVRE